MKPSKLPLMTRALVRVQRMVRRIFCKHALAWVRNIHGDEIELIVARTLANDRVQEAARSKEGSVRSMPCSVAECVHPADKLLWYDGSLHCFVCRHTWHGPEFPPHAGPPSVWGRPPNEQAHLPAPAETVERKKTNL